MSIRAIRFGLLVALGLAMLGAMAAAVRAQTSCPPPGWTPPTAGPNDYYFIMCLPPGSHPYGSTPAPTDQPLPTDRMRVGTPDAANPDRGQCYPITPNAAVRWAVGVQRYVGAVFAADGPALPNFLPQASEYAYVPEYLQGSPQHAMRMVSAETLGPIARLRLRVSMDVDASFGSIDPRGRVYFNGYWVQDLAQAVGRQQANGGWLSANQHAWFPVEYDIPIQYVRFPGSPGTETSFPTESLNTVEIRTDRDQSSGDVRTACIAVDSVTLEIRVCAPIVLIHGRNSDQLFWGEEDEGDSFAQALVDGYFNVNRMNLSAPVVVDGRTWKLCQLRANAVQTMAAFELSIRRSLHYWGASQVQPLVHSMGGLWTRWFIALRFAKVEEWIQTQFPGSTARLFVGITSLATPHNGTPIADLACEAHQKNRTMTLNFQIQNQSYEGAWEAWLAASIGGFLWLPCDESLRTASQGEDFKLQLDSLRSFSPLWLVVGADADLNTNGDIDSGEGDEVDWFGGRLGLLNYMYHYIRDYSTVTVTPDYVIERMVVTGVLANNSQLNDIVVPIDSALGKDTMNRFAAVTDRWVLAPTSQTHPFGKNHSSIGDQQVAQSIIVPLKSFDAVAGGMSTWSR